MCSNVILWRWELCCCRRRRRRCWKRQLRCGRLLFLFCLFRVRERDLDFVRLAVLVGRGPEMSFHRVLGRGNWTRNRWLWGQADRFAHHNAKTRDKRMKDHERENQNVSRPLSFTPLSFTPPPSSDRQRREDVLLFIFLIIFLIIIFLFLIFIFILFFSGCQERLDEERLVDRKELLDERRLCDPEREAKDAGKGQKEAHNLV